MFGVSRKTESGDDRRPKRTSGIHARAGVENGEPDHGS